MGHGGYDHSGWGCRLEEGGGRGGYRIRMVWDSVYGRKVTLLLVLADISLLLFFWRLCASWAELKVGGVPIYVSFVLLFG